MDVFIFGTLFYLIVSVILHFTGNDPIAFVMFEGSLFFGLMYIIAKSEDK